ncbi:MAG: maleylpyruvate isomerase family mycothiol-dependent enzyme [Thermomicrobiales bacterium]|nr:maleylpyruvate isomerase family mycothiol-dependent enzyme [Thermomicrobiales bacterium]
MSLPPIDVVDLFPEERAALLEVLSPLSAEAWETPTVCAGWSVKDIALHLLGDDVGMLGRGRDGHTSPNFAEGLDISTWDGLLAAINRQNAAWVYATRRMSARLLLDLLALTGEQTADYFRELDPNQLGDPVDWAGPDPAPAWMHVVREYTERWVHQQHIRDALGRPGFTERRVFQPVLDAFARALPHTLRSTPANTGTRVQLAISGDAGGAWTAVRQLDRWTLAAEGDAHVAARVRMDQDLAWRVFTKGVDEATVRRFAVVEGDRTLAEPILGMVSILA